MPRWLEVILEQLESVCKEVAEEEERLASNEIAQSLEKPLELDLHSDMEEQVFKTLSTACCGALIHGIRGRQKARAEAICAILSAEGAVPAKYWKGVQRKLNMMLAPVTGVESAALDKIRALAS